MMASAVAPAGEGLNIAGKISIWMVASQTGHLAAAPELQNPPGRED
jgi:hypothetical protein